MQASSVFVAVEVCSSQLDDGPVVPPKKSADDNVEQVCQNCVTPKSLTKAELRSKLGEERLVIIGRASIVIPGHVDW